jgi:hypothetical protein
MGTHEETELDLYLYNTSELWPLHESIVQNLKRKIERGTYDPARAPDAWIYWVEAGAKRYVREFGGGAWFQVFDKQTRDALAIDIAQREYGKIVGGEYGKIDVPGRMRVHENPAPRLLYMYTARIGGVYRDVWAVDGDEAVEKFKREGARGFFTVSKVTNVSPRLENPMGVPVGALVAAGLVAAAGIAYALYGGSKAAAVKTVTPPTTPSTPSTPSAPPNLIDNLPGPALDPTTNLVLFNTYTDAIMTIRTGAPDAAGTLPSAGVTVNVVDAGGNTLVVPLIGYLATAAGPGKWIGINPSTKVLMYIMAADVQSMS